MRLMLPASRLEEHRDNVDAVVREAEDPGEDIGGAPREGGESGVRASEAVGCFVECAVTAGTTTGRSSPGRRIGQTVAWPRRLVSARVTSWSVDNALWITTRRRAVTDEADSR